MSRYTEKYMIALLLSMLWAETAFCQVDSSFSKPPPSKGFYYAGSLRAEKAALENTYGDAGAYAYNNKWVYQMHLKFPADTVVRSMHESLNFCISWQCASMALHEKSYKRAFLKDADSVVVHEYDCMHERCAEFEKSLNRDLMQRISAMKERDGRIRDGIPTDTDASVNNALWLKQSSLDSMNQLELTEILKTHGYPGRSLVGEELCGVALEVILHADLEYQNAAFPLVLKATEERQLRMLAFTYLIDRRLVFQDKKQIYGTQAVWSKKINKMAIAPIDQIETLEQRRKMAGLGELVDYMRKMEITEILTAYD